MNMTLTPDQQVTLLVNVAVLVAGALLIGFLVGSWWESRHTAAHDAEVATKGIRATLNFPDSGGLYHMVLAENPDKSKFAAEVRLDEHKKNCICSQYPDNKVGCPRRTKLETELRGSK